MSPLRSIGHCLHTLWVAPSRSLFCLCLSFSAQFRASVLHIHIIHMLLSPVPPPSFSSSCSSAAIHSCTNTPRPPPSSSSPAMSCAAAQPEKQKGNFSYTLFTKKKRRQRPGVCCLLAALLPCAHQGTSCIPNPTLWLPGAYNVQINKFHAYSVDWGMWGDFSNYYIQINFWVSRPPLLPPPYRLVPCLPNSRTAAKNDARGPKRMNERTKVARREMPPSPSPPPPFSWRCHWRRARGAGASARRWTRGCRGRCGCALLCLCVVVGEKVGGRLNPSIDRSPPHIHIHPIKPAKKTPHRPQTSSPASPAPRRCPCGGRSP